MDRESKAMKATDAQYRAKQKYIKEKCKQVTLQLSKNTDADIISWLEESGNKQGYIKQLIREDMTRKGFKMPADE